MKLRPRRPLIIALSAQAFVAGWIFTMGVTNWLPLIMLMAFFAGVAMDFFMVIWNTAMQSNIPRDSLSRVTSYDAFGSLAFAPIGLIIAGPITERIGTEQTLIGMAIIFWTLLSVMLCVPSVRNLRGQNLEAEST